MFEFLLKSNLLIKITTEKKFTNVYLMIKKKLLTRYSNSFRFPIQNQI